MRPRDALTGQAIVAYVTLKDGDEGSLEMLEELRNHVAAKIGPIAKPANIVFTPELPKTRSREDHAPAAPRRGREPAARRHDDARRPHGRQRDRRPGRRGRIGGVDHREGLKRGSGPLRAFHGTGAHAGISVDDFEHQADTSLRTAQHPTLGRGYLACAAARRPQMIDTGMSHIGIRCVRRDGLKLLVLRQPVRDLEPLRLRPDKYMLVGRIEGRRPATPWRRHDAPSRTTE